MQTGWIYGVVGFEHALNRQEVSSPIQKLKVVKGEIKNIYRIHGLERYNLGMSYTCPFKFYICIIL